MKIIYPYVAANEVGYTISAVPDRYFHDDNRPNVYGAVRRNPIIEYSLTTGVALDHDFKLARRAAGLGHLLLVTAAIPPVFGCYAVYTAGEFVGRQMETFCSAIADLVYKAGVPQNGSLGSLYRTLISRVFAR